MSPRVRDAAGGSGDDDEQDAGDGLDARWEPDAEEAEDDGSPLTHLSDEDYEEFVAHDLPGATPAGEGPPMVPILLGITLLVVLVILWLA